MGILLALLLAGCDADMKPDKFKVSLSQDVNTLDDGLDPRVGIQWEWDLHDVER